MDFKTKESYERYINNSYVDMNPELAFTTHTKPDRHYIYPKYEVFEKVLTDTFEVSNFTNDLFTRLTASAIFAQIEKKPVDLLNDEEKLGIFIGAGIPMKYENGNINTLYDVGISLIDAKYRVYYKLPDLSNTYC